jgi:serine/threonine-protein kinase
VSTAGGPGGRTPDGHGFADEDDRYRLDSRIATGGMGEVWRATDTTLGRTVAVKLLKPEYADDPSFRSRFSTEARHAASLHHPGVAAVYDFGESSRTDGSGSPRPYLVMELVDGQPLSALLRPGQPLDPAATRDLLAQAADAIGAAHAAGIVHRDVKPANLLVTPSRRIKITDFGIARATEGVGLTETGQVMGTPQYLSPEQAEGRQATPASDVYSLGVVAFECLAGRRPFVAETAVATALAHLREPVPELPPDVPADLAAVVRRALSKKPGDRYPDATAFAAALRDPATAATRIVAAPTQVLTGTAPAAGAAGAAGAGAAGVGTAGAGEEADPTRSRRRGRGPWIVLAAAAVLLALVLLALLLNQGPDDTTATQQPTRTPTSSPTTAAPTTAAPTTRAPSPSPRPASSSPANPTTSATPDTTVTIDEDDYLGRDLKDVEKELEKLGLRVDTNELENPGTETENAVDSVDPDGELQEGDTVTVSYFGPAPVPESPSTSGPGSSDGSSSSSPNGTSNGSNGKSQGKAR